MKNRTWLLARILVGLALPTTQSRAQSIYTPYSFTTLAGSAAYGSADGTGGAARFYAPNGLAMDNAGTVYVVDTFNQTIRKVTPTGVVTTLAGLAGFYGSVDGTGSTARFTNPYGIAVDGAGNVYVTDTYNSTIRKITRVGVVTTLGGLAGSSGSQDGAGNAARFYVPYGVAVDGAGTIYVADTGNHTIRKITPAGVVTTLAGLAGSSGSADGTGSDARFKGPEGLAVDSAGTVYATDWYPDYSIRKVTPAGVVTTLLAAGGGQSVAVDSAENIYVFGNSILKLTPTGVVSTLVSQDGVRGTGFRQPSGLAADGQGNVYVADEGNNTIRKVTPAGVVTTLAGLAVYPGSKDATGGEARFWNPTGVAVDGTGNVYVEDSNNTAIRKVTPTGVVTTLAGLAGSDGSGDAIGSTARFNTGYRGGVAVDNSGNVYVANAGNRTIQKVTPAGVVSTLPPGVYGYGVAVDSAGNVYVVDNGTIREVTPAGVVTDLAGGGYGSVDGTGSSARFATPSGIAVDRAGNIYVTDAGNFTIRKVTPAAVVTTLAGLAFQYGSTDGTGSAARFGGILGGPSGITVDGAGNVYVTDTGNFTIRKVTPAGVVTTLAGLAPYDSNGNTMDFGGSPDATGSAARFNYPYGIAVDGAGNVYVADAGNNRIAKGTQSYLEFDTSSRNLTFSHGLMEMRLTGPSGSNFIVERSANLRAWMPIQTNRLPSVGVSIQMSADPSQFFRAHLVP